MLLGGRIRGRFSASQNGEEVDHMYDIPYLLECLLALLKEVPNFLDLIVRYAVEIISAV